MAKMSEFIIAATSSGCGKTTFSLGLMRALRERGEEVRPFKCGPDYIDTQFHCIASGRESVNLDSYMASGQYVKNLYMRRSCGGTVSVVEGVMGMFDGYERMSGSSADMAILLGLPVILLVNAASTAYSVAAMIHGFKTFRPEVNVVGVVFNRVSSDRHFSFMKDACTDAGVECLGYIPRSNGLQTPSRHLGLTISGREEMERFVVAAAEAVSSHVDIDRLLEITSRTSVKEYDFEKQTDADKRGLRVAVARDDAFNFIYPENIVALGVQNVEYFSPLHDTALPADVDIVYLPGGYPELYAAGLEANKAMRSAVKEYVERGGKLIAECGGMIYLTRDIDGVEMCGVIPTSTTMKDARLTLGYRTVELPGLTIRGHEFHYSRLTEPGVYKSAARLTDVKGREVATPLYHYKNTYAGYTHLYWGDSDILKLWKL